MSDLFQKLPGAQVNTPNDPIATRPAGRVDCNRNAIAGFAACVWLLGRVIVSFPSPYQSILRVNDLSDSSETTFSQDSRRGVRFRERVGSPTPRHWRPACNRGLIAG